MGLLNAINSFGKALGNVFKGETAPIPVDTETAHRCLIVPAWTNFHPSVDAFQSRGFRIHGNMEARNLGAKICVEAPEGSSAWSGGIVGMFKDAQGQALAEYLTMPKRFGHTADLTLSTEPRKEE